MGALIFPLSGLHNISIIFMMENVVIYKLNTLMVVIKKNFMTLTVVPTKSDSDVVFCL